MGEGDFPKTDGDVLYASEVNDFYNYPKVLHYGSSATGETFTPTKSDSRIVVWVKGEATLTGGTTASATIDLDIDSVTKDTVSLDSVRFAGASSSDEMSFTLMWSDTDLATSSTDIEVTGGSLSNLKIIVMEYLKE